MPDPFILRRYSNCFMVLLNQRQKGQDGATIELSTGAAGGGNNSRMRAESISALAFAPNTTDSTLTQLSDDLTSRKSMERRIEIYAEP